MGDCDQELQPTGSHSEEEGTFLTLAVYRIAYFTLHTYMSIHCIVYTLYVWLECQVFTLKLSGSCPLSISFFPYVSSSVFLFYFGITNPCLCSRFLFALPPLCLSAPDCLSHLCLITPNWPCIYSPSVFCIFATSLTLTAQILALSIVIAPLCLNPACLLDLDF